MLKHGVPWQFALAIAFLQVLIFVALMVASLLSGYFNWFPILTVLFLAIGFILILSLIPTLLNLSRAYFITNIVLLISHVLVTILSFGLHFKSAGLIQNSVHYAPDFFDAIYFSITTFTTLGYGDFQPTSSMRLLTSVEALAGMASMAVGASLIWLWCQENLIPKEMAYFDGNRRHKGDLDETRMRVRTFTGKERNLPDWMMPFKDNETVTYDPKLQEWVTVTDDKEIK